LPNAARKALNADGFNTPTGLKTFGGDFSTTPLFFVLFFLRLFPTCGPDRDGSNLFAAGKYGDQLRSRTGKLLAVRNRLAD
jgi:hypothetical protein